MQYRHEKEIFKKIQNKEMSQFRPLICVSLMNNIDDYLIIFDVNNKRKKRSQDRREISLNKRNYVTILHNTGRSTRAREMCVCVCNVYKIVSGLAVEDFFFRSDLFVFVFVKKGKFNNNNKKNRWFSINWVASEHIRHSNNFVLFFLFSRIFLVFIKSFHPKRPISQLIRPHF